MSDSRDRYERFTASEEYRASRTRKANVIAHLCAPYLTGEARVVDLGAGTGIVRKVLEVISGNQIFGIEIDGSFIAERERMVRGDVLRLPLASESIDFAMLNHLYEHVGDPGLLFEETYRILRPGGRAYVTAGSRLAIMEPHYRLPFLSWLPRASASAYLRLTRKGRSYDDIRFLTYRPLTRLMRAAGFIVKDVTESTIDDLIQSTWGDPWAAVWGGIRKIPPGARHSLLRVGSPQWFFFLEKPARPGTGEANGTA